MNNRVFFIHKGEDVLVSIKTNEDVPEDEPVFILRARDRKAPSTIRVYQSTTRPASKEWKTLEAVLDDFRKFREENPGLMGDPSEVY